MISVDIVVPCYNEEESLAPFAEAVDRVAASLPGYEFTYILVDDGSADGTYAVMKELAGQHGNIKYISFSRNFGKEAAMYAGLKNSTGDYVIVMDADLQHPPEVFPQLLEAVVSEGYDCCATKRDARKGEGLLRGTFSKMFFRLSNRLTDVSMPYGAMDYRVMSRRMVDSLMELSEVQRFSKGLFAWVGFRTKWLTIETAERQLGKTTWNFRKLLKYAMDGIACFSVAPLRFAAAAGGLVFTGGLVYTLVTIIRALAYDAETPGWTAVLCAALLLGGMIEFSIGVSADYIGRIYLQAKNRPVYIVGGSNIEGVKGSGAR